MEAVLALLVNSLMNWYSQYYGQKSYCSSTSFSFIYFGQTGFVLSLYISID